MLISMPWVEIIITSRCPPVMPEQGLERWKGKAGKGIWGNAALPGLEMRGLMKLSSREGLRMAPGDSNTRDDRRGMTSEEQHGLLIPFHHGQMRGVPGNSR